MFNEHLQLEIFEQRFLNGAKSSERMINSESYNFFLTFFMQNSIVAAVQ